MKVYGHVEGCEWIKDVEIVTDIKQADVVLLVGDGDIYPKIYGARTTELSNYDKNRDLLDLKLFIEARANGKPCFGINRGYLMLGAMAGCMIVQDLTHPPVHDIRLINGEKHTVESNHHQEVYPWNRLNSLRDYYAIGESCSRSHRLYKAEVREACSPNTDIEIVYFDRIAAIGCLFYPTTPELVDLMNRLLVSLVKGTVREDFSRNDPEAKKIFAALERMETERLERERLRAEAAANQAVTFAAAGTAITTTASTMTWNGADISMFGPATERYEMLPLEGEVSQMRVDTWNAEIEILIDGAWQYWGYVDDNGTYTIGERPDEEEEWEEDWDVDEMAEDDEMPPPEDPDGSF